jgi:serine/threonine protein kinase
VVEAAAPAGSAESVTASGENIPVVAATQGPTLDPGATHGFGTQQEALATAGQAVWPSVPGYEILGELGQGGMGIVYRARQKGLNRIVALKMIRRERLAQSDSVRRFQREAKAVARLSDPHIVTIHDAAEVGGTHFLTMEYVDGTDLGKLVHERGPLPVAQACDYVRQAALGLQHAHERGLVHRDIKPNNLMLTADGVVKILDMGLARMIHGSEEGDSFSALTHEGAVMGTPDFIAPEQALDPRQADIRADIYSLGCTLYYLLTGRVPFPGGTLIQKLDKHRWGEPPAVQEVRPEVPRGLIAIVRKMMAKSPADRYQTPGDVAEALAPFCHWSNLSGRAPESTEAQSSPSQELPAQLSSALAGMDDPAPPNEGGILPRLSKRKKDRELARDRGKEKTGRGYTERRWSWRWKLGMILGGLLLLLVPCVLTILWLIPPRPTTLVLIGAGYENNLAVEPNVYGMNGLDAIKSLKNSKEWGFVSVRQAPGPLQKDTDWEATLGNPAEKTIIVFLALHGGRDAQGAYLLRNDANLNDDDPESNLLRVNKVVQRLKQLPADKNKMLILDATQVPSDWDRGALHNDFARGLEELRDQIGRDPRLVVFSASGVDQRSWASPEWRQTIFTHYLIEGLKGAADLPPYGDDNRRITADELAKYVKENVRKWALDNRDALQEPVVLGNPDALKMELFSVPRKYEPPANPEQLPFPEADLLLLWKRYHQLEQQVPRPWVYQPEQWRLYQAKVRRFEQLALAGSETRNLRAELDQLAEGLRLGGRLDHWPVAGNTLSMPAALGLWPDKSLEDKKLDDLIADLLQAPALLMENWERPLADRLFRLRLLGRALHQAAQNPDDLKGVIKLLPQLKASGNQRPAEIHFLAMLSHLDPQRRPQNTDLRDALRLRCLAESVALAVQADETTGELRERVHPYSEQVYPWIRAKVEQADTERQLGQDLLFATRDDSWREARQHLQKARDLYKAASTQAAAVRSALETRDEVFAFLPAYSHWLAEREPDPVTTALLKQVEDLWEKAHRLAQRLEQVSGDDLKAEEVRKAFKDVESQFDADAKQWVGGQALQPTWHKIQAALAVPRMDEDTRIGLLRSLTQISRKFHDGSFRRFGNARPITPEANEDKVKARAAREGRMCLAALGPRWFDDASHAVNLKVDNYHDVSDRVSRLGTNEKWADSAIRAGEAISLRWRRLPVQMNKYAEHARGTKLTEAEADLGSAERLARLADAGLVPLLQTNPAGEARRLRVHDLFLWQTDRTRTDHWFGDDPNGDPYYLTAGMEYVNDAEELVSANLTDQQKPGRLGEVERHRELLRRPGDLIVQAVDALNGIDVTDVAREQPVTVVYEVRPKPSGWVPDGYAVHETELGALLKKPAQKPGRDVLQVFEKKPAAPIRVELKPDVTPTRVPDTKRTSVFVKGFYRGQELGKPTEVRLHRCPDTLWVEHPTGKLPAGVAVRADPNVWRQYSPGKGGIAIVVDASGSMRDPQPANPYVPLKADTDSKYKDALDQLQTVLKQVEKGTTVSVLIFGQAIDPPRENATDEPERHLVWVRRPKPWDPDALDSLMQDLRPPRVQPYNHASLIRGMVEARRNGFPEGFKGFKTVIALTDGIDDRFVADRNLWADYANQAEFKELDRLDGLSSAERGEKIAAAMSKFMYEEFKDCGVQINLVGFLRLHERDSAELANILFRKKFEVITKLPLKGKVYTSSDPAVLLRDLKRVMVRSIEFYLEPDGDTPPSRGLEKPGQVSGPGMRDQWKHVPSGTYVLHIQTDRDVKQRISLESGDYLRLILVGDAEGLHYERVLMGEENNAPRVKKDNWVLAAHQNQRLRDGTAELLLTLEPRNDRGRRSSRDIVRQVRPNAMWLEVRVPGRPGQPPLRRDNRLRYPAPTWGVLLPEWSQRTDANDTPVVTAWVNWQDDAKYYSRDFDHSAQFESYFTDPKNRKVQLGDINREAVFESVTYEPFEVESAPGMPPKQEMCLVVRLRYTKGHPVWADVRGLPVEGREHRFYAEAGRYTGLFWPVTREQIQDKLNSIRIIPVDEFKTQPTTRQLPDLPLRPPNPASTPPPAVPMATKDQP